MLSMIRIFHPRRRHCRQVSDAFSLISNRKLRQQLSLMFRPVILLPTARTSMVRGSQVPVQVWQPAETGSPYNFWFR
jgi:hypothetical protein